MDPELLANSIRKVNGVRQVNRVRSRWIGTDKSVDLVISVDSDISTNDSHKIATAVESVIEKEYDVSDISIHIEPYYEKSKN